ncbi:virion core protein, T7 gp14 family [Phaeospirillum tilakii]|uniref:Internal virion protein n=1 Tax=Phaeospirillum tilakii TaxID=741673 RepID=A0ABW5CDX8_9PROT
MGWIAVGVATVATIAQTTMSAMQASAQADAQEKQYRYQADQARANASFMEQNAKATEDAGRSAEQRQRVINNQQLGQMRAQAGASGLDVGSDTLVDSFATQSAMGEVDALNVRNNYQREANQYWQQKANYDSQANWYDSAASKVDPTMEIAGIAAGGLGKVASSWTSFFGSPSSASETSNLFGNASTTFGAPASSTDISGLTLKPSNFSLRVR